MALNAAIFGSVLLASRLPTRVHVFGLVSLAVNWFALFPLLRSAIRSALPPAANIAMTAAMIAGSAIGIYKICAPVLSLAYSLSIAFLTLVIPAWFMALQAYKKTIHGPWDEATVTIKPMQ